MDPGSPLLEGALDLLGPVAELPLPLVRVAHLVGPKIPVPQTDAPRPSGLFELLQGGAELPLATSERRDVESGADEELPDRVAHHAQHLVRPGESHLPLSGMSGLEDLSDDGHESPEGIGAGEDLVGGEPHDVRERAAPGAKGRGVGIHQPPGGDPARRVPHELPDVDLHGPVLEEAPVQDVPRGRRGSGPVRRSQRAPRGRPRCTGPGTRENHGPASRHGVGENTSAGVGPRAICGRAAMTAGSSRRPRARGERSSPQAADAFAEASSGQA